MFESSFAAHMASAQRKEAPRSAAPAAPAPPCVGPHQAEPTPWANLCQRCQAELRQVAADLRTASRAHGVPGQPTLGRMMAAAPVPLSAEGPSKDEPFWWP